MKRIPKQEYTAEFKAQAVKRADEVGSIARVAEELGLVGLIAVFLATRIGPVENHSQAD